MKRYQLALTLACMAVALLIVCDAARAEVPVRISIKFILSATGTRPATGRLNTDAEILGEFDAGEGILRSNLSEFALSRIQFVDLAGVSQYYSASATETNRDALRAAAIANPSLYLWRTDAINIYINGGTGSAISQFPPDNDIILMNQGCTNTPSCMLHELGHSLNLWHTHSTSETCTDTITDNQSWSKDDIAWNNFGCLYANCSVSQQDAVDLVFNNVMSYHVSEPQTRFSTCQLNRVSAQGDSDRAWLLTRDPVYVNSGYGGLFEFGTYYFPYNTLVEAVNAGGLDNKVIVLQQGTYYYQNEINAGVEMVTRLGTSRVEPPGAQHYVLPVNLEHSDVADVRSAITAVQEEDKAARRAVKDAEKEAEKALKEEDRKAILSAAKIKKKAHQDNALAFLQRAERHAGGDEKLAIQLELAERYRDAGDCEQAVDYFIRVAEATDQEHLAIHALNEADACQEKIQTSPANPRETTEEQPPVRNDE